MIWSPEEQAGQTGSGVVDSLVSDVEMLAEQGVTDVSRETMEELARAVDYFIKTDCPSQTVEDAALHGLVARALSSLGQGAAGRRLYLVGTGLVQCAEWDVLGGRMLWALDLRRVTLQDGALLEMMLFRTLAVVLDSISDVWDQSEGAGVLGLRNVASVVAEVCGEGNGSRRKRAATLADEIYTFSEARLARIAEGRAWRETPRVLALDPFARGR